MFNNKQNEWSTQFYKCFKNKIKIMTFFVNKFLTAKSIIFDWNRINKTVGSFKIIFISFILQSQND